MSYPKMSNDQKKPAGAQEPETQRTPKEQNAQNTQSAQHAQKAQNPQNPQGKTLRLSIAVVLILAVLTMLALLVTLAHTDQVACTETRSGMPLTTIEQVTETKIKRADAPTGLINCYTFRLDEPIAHDTSLAFYTTHQYAAVYLDGELVCSLQPAGEHRITKTLGSNWVMIPLYAEDSGKTVRVEITPAYQSFQNRDVTFLLDSPLAVYKDRLTQDLPQILLGGIAVLTGLTFLCIAAWSLLQKRPGKKLAALGLFSVMLGVWKLNDMRFTPFMDGDEPVLIYYIAIMMLMFAILPLVQWTKEFFGPKARRVLDLYACALTLLCLLLLALQWLRIYDLRETLLAIHTAIGIGAVLVFVLAVSSRRGKKDGGTLPLQIRLAVLCVAGILADVAAFYIKGNSSGLLFSLTALDLYILIMGIHSMSEYSRQQIQIAKLDRTLAEQERRLTDSRIKMMMSQIRSHFIFNVLATISTYCKIDPQTADQALICFSRYLRRNIRIIEEDRPIAFSSELEQLEDYVTLEQLRFADRIRFQKDIQTSSFELPPLTVQPIVENAIKHGFLEHGRSGTVCLATRREAGRVVITVRDDGAGFDVQAMQGKESIVLRNVRYRLETMVGGSLAISSEPGRGTTVTIQLPLKEED